MWTIYFLKSVQKDIALLKRAGLLEKANQLLRVISKDPFQNPPPYEKLYGNFKDHYSRRINLRHRLVYRIDETNKAIIVIMMWSHYGD